MEGDGAVTFGLAVIIAVLTGIMPGVADVAPILALITLGPAVTAQ